MHPSYDLQTDSMFLQTRFDSSVSGWSSSHLSSSWSNPLKTMVDYFQIACFVYSYLPVPDTFQVLLQMFLLCFNSSITTFHLLTLMLYSLVNIFQCLKLRISLSFDASRWLKSFLSSSISICNRLFHIGSFLPATFSTFTPNLFVTTTAPAWSNSLVFVILCVLNLLKTYF